MSVPNRISPPPGVIYDDVEGVCRAEPLLAEAPVCEQVCRAPSAGTPPVDRYASISHSQLIADALGNSRQSVQRTWGNPLAHSFWTVLSGPVACSGPAEPVQPGDPVRSATPQGAASVMNAQPLSGNLNEYDLSGGAEATATVWSVFNSTVPAETGTFAFVRNGAAAGTLVTASNETSALHKFTTSATLEDGSSIVAYTKATGEEEPSSIVARRISASGAVEGSDITILAPGVRATLPDAQLVATASGFVAVYRNGDGRLMAAAFNNSGVAQGSPEDLGPAPSRYAVNRDEDGHWVLAEIISDNEIRLRTFDGVRATGVDETISTSGFPASPGLSVAMQEGGTMMVAWNKDGGGIMGAVFNGEGGISGSPFEIRSSGLANTMSLASDHRGNFVFAWEEAGAILARVYNGTPSFTTPADFATISSGNSNSNVQAHVSDTGRLVLTWVQSSSSGGETLQDLMRREYQLNY
ncbi:MAG TPA: hypothetical protein VJP40_02500 [bacterium]|nr:hypothetical protein [bacterium]